MSIGDKHSTAIRGVIIGTAVGDALGLPHEGLSPQRIARRLGERPLRHQMLWGRGLVSDDTEHTSMVARALVVSSGNVESFTRSFAGQLKRWILTMPPGVGLATLRGALRLLVGVSPARSGVDSAGNGPAMRSALLGVCARNDEHLCALVRASTRMTHTDPRAEDGARLVARLARQLSCGRLDAAIVDDVRDAEFRRCVRHAWKETSIEAYRGIHPRGVSGFVVHTVPAAIHCALHGGGAAGAIERAVRLGGDTDTTAAIAGALVGARDGVEGFPSAWIEGIRDWPMSIRALHSAADAVVGEAPGQPARWIASAVRNVAVVAVVGAHVVIRWAGR